MLLRLREGTVGDKPLVATVGSGSDRSLLTDLSRSTYASHGAVEPLFLAVGDAPRPGGTCSIASPSLSLVTSLANVHRL
jgi:hypothetical protein